jgi:DNA-directed RNA polymerase specialized sigma subunit
VNACKTLASHICMDVQRASVRRNDHEGPSLDDGWNADGDDRLVPVWEADEAAWRFERGEHGAEIRDFLGWALPQLGEDQRRVLAMTFEGDPVPEIVDTLGITAANAYQLRSRGFKELARLKERYDA